MFSVIFSCLISGKNTRIWRGVSVFRCFFFLSWEMRRVENMVLFRHDVLTDKVGGCCNLGAAYLFEHRLDMDA